MQENPKFEHAFLGQGTDCRLLKKLMIISFDFQCIK